MVKDILTKGINAREGGNYKDGEKLLKEAYILSKNLREDKLIIECGNQLSIQYRLLAGRCARSLDQISAKKYSLQSLALYHELVREGLMDLTDKSIQRNYAHALLYAGYIKHGIKELQKSIEMQIEKEIKGDELCHLASAYTDEVSRDLEKIKMLVDEGINLIKVNNGSPIALTYGLMTKATALSLERNRLGAIGMLKEAMDISNERKLTVRIEEIEYLLAKDFQKINVLDAVSGVLREERRNQRYENR